RASFPGARYVTPEDAKECVVKGACTTRRAGVEVDRGNRPSVRIRFGRHEVLTATTSRLGIQVNDAEGAWFHELVGAGVAIPEEGLTVVLEMVLQPGLNVLPVLENAGLEDRLPNPDVEVIRKFEIALPEELDPLDLEEVQLTFTVLPDMALKVRVNVPTHQELEFDTIAATEYGRGY
ncbi:MAG: hypothetical protein AB1758_28220, partial [Candidatus Eremiobacterota bacterium]